MKELYQKFVTILKMSQKEGVIKILHRGESKKYAFKCFALDDKIHTIEHFAEKLFFFGSKSRYFWNDRINPHEDLYFEINDVSNRFFDYIFDEFYNLSKKQNIKEGTSSFFRRNKEIIEFFRDGSNKISFVENISSLTKDEKFSVRNYYLRILHQLGESNYKKKSQFISSTEIESEAEKFSNEDIVISFWDLNFKAPKLPKTIPIFAGKPYAKQKEISVFTAIFPQFIYSFKYRDKIYVNPALGYSSDLENIVLSGFRINQDDFENKRKKETNLAKSVSTDGYEFWETI